MRVTLRCWRNQGPAQQNELTMQNDSNGPQNLSQTLHERFWREVVIIPYDRGCWFWTGCTDPYGYGVINTVTKGTKLIAAHRLSWLIHRGAIPTGICVLHRCDIPRCVRPDHLFIGTKADNTLDMCSKDRARGGTPKLTWDDVSKIRERAGENQYAMAIEFGVTQSTISRIISFEKRRFH